MRRTVAYLSGTPYPEWEHQATERWTVESCEDIALLQRNVLDRRRWRAVRNHG